MNLKEQITSVEKAGQKIRAGLQHKAPQQIAQQLIEEHGVRIEATPDDLAGQLYNPHGFKHGPKIKVGAASVSCRREPDGPVTIFLPKHLTGSERTKMVLHHIGLSLVIEPPVLSPTVDLVDIIAAQRELAPVGEAFFHAVAETADLYRPQWS